MLTEVFDTGPLHAWVVLDLPDAQKGGRLRSASTAVLRGRPRGSAPHDAHKRCRPGAYLAPQALSATTSAPGRRCSQARTAGSRAVLLPEPTAIPGNPRQSTGIGRGERRDAARLEVLVLQALRRRPLAEVFELHTREDPGSKPGAPMLNGGCYLTVQRPTRGLRMVSGGLGGPSFRSVGPRAMPQATDATDHGRHGVPYPEKAPCLLNRR